MKRQEKIFLFIVAVLCVALVMAVFFLSKKSYYSNAYTPIVEKSLRNQAIMEQNRKAHPRDYEHQPSAPGFKESDIDKSKGSGYSTY